MRKVFLVITTIIVAATFNSCSNNKSGTPESETSPASAPKNDEAKSKRPEKTEKNLRSIVYKFDSKVASVSSTLRDLKDDIEKGAKVTPKIEDNFNKMVSDAKKLRESILPQSDSLAAEEFRIFDRDKDWIDQLDADFETVKQTAKNPQ